jgi:cyclophilin family peptidyl-prolyl cis-trans isomerase
MKPLLQTTSQRLDWPTLTYGLGSALALALAWTWVSSPQLAESGRIIPGSRDRAATNRSAPLPPTGGLRLTASKVQEIAGVDDSYLLEEARLAGLSVAELQAEFDQRLQEWRLQYARMGQGYMQFYFQKESESGIWAGQFNDARVQGEKARKAAGHVAMHLLEKMTAPPSQELADLAYRSIDAYLLFHEYRKAYRTAKALVERGHQRPYLLPLYGYAAYSVNEFSEARSVFSQAIILGETLNEQQQSAFENSGRGQAIIDAEQTALAVDEDAELPIIEFQTTKGKMVVELFEDNAPNTVKNMVFLVEQGFFKDRDFYEITDNLIFTASPTNDAAGRVSYSIKSEHELPNRRPHLRGYLTMLVDVESQLASCQFAIVTQPRPDLDAQLNTVFGRIIEGDLLLDNLERAGSLWQTAITAPNSMIGPADKILSARVVRKRDYNYYPERVNR